MWKTSQGPEVISEIDFLTVEKKKAISRGAIKSIMKIRHCRNGELHFDRAVRLWQERSTVYYEPKKQGIWLL